MLQIKKQPSPGIAWAWWKLRTLEKSIHGFTSQREKHSFASHIKFTKLKERFTLHLLQHIKKFTSKCTFAKLSSKCLLRGRSQAEEVELLQQEKIKKSTKRGKQWSGLRRARKRASLMHLPVVTTPFVPLVLDGDQVDPIPPYLKLMLRLGPKFVPHQHPAKCMQHKLRFLPGEIEQLARVLKWSTFFESIEKPDVDFYSMLPYKAMHRPTGRPPPPAVEKKLGPFVARIENAVTAARDEAVLSLSSLKPSDFVLRGITWVTSHVDAYLSKHVVVSGDKDASLVVMSRNTYQREVNANMDGMSPNGLPCYRKICDDNDMAALDSWLEKAKQWQTCLAQLCMDTMPPVLMEALGKFFDTHPPPVWANFHLLVKTHKRKSVLNGRWPSRPIVGLFAWATMASSKLVGILGRILLSLDKRSSPLDTPLLDTMDFIERLHACSSECDGRDIHAPLCTSIHFSALYTNFQWSDVSRAFRFWRDYFYRTPWLVELSSHERQMCDWLFTPMSHNCFNEYNDHFPFSYVVYHPALCFGEFLLHIVFSHCLFCTPG